MKTFVCTFGIAVAPEEIHRIAGDINSILQARGHVRMRSLNNGVRGGPYYKHVPSHDPNLEFSYNFVELIGEPGGSWEEEEFKDLAILLDVMSKDFTVLQSLEPPLIEIGFVKIQSESFIPGDPDSREVHFQLEPKTTAP